MKSRIEILRDLVRLNRDIHLIQNELRQLEWDSEELFVIINNNDLVYIFDRFITGQISSDMIEDWANTIECRDDIGYKSDQLKEIIHELANPELFEKIDHQKISFLKTILKMS